MKFNDDLYEHVRKGGKIKRSAWGDKASLTNASLVGIYRGDDFYIEHNGQAYKYAFSFEDAVAEDWEICDG